MCVRGAPHSILRFSTLTPCPCVLSPVAVYITGHRLGYENTDSYLAFWDLNKLEEGDEFYITNSQGSKYTYEVFRKFTAGPENLSVLAPVDGRNIVTLQTCTLPDYTNRLLVRGEIKDIEGA